MKAIGSSPAWNWTLTGFHVLNLGQNEDLNSEAHNVRVSADEQRLILVVLLL